MSGKMRMVFSPERSAALGRSLLDAGIAPDLRRMFGHEVFFLNGYMFAGACLDGVFVHLGADAVQDALAREPGVAAFSPADGMTMKDYLLLGPAIADDAGRLRPWLVASAEYLRARPPKVAKPRTPRPASRRRG